MIFNNVITLSPELLGAEILFLFIQIFLKKDKDF